MIVMKTKEQDFEIKLHFPYYLLIYNRINFSKIKMPFFSLIIQREMKGSRYICIGVIHISK